MAPGPHTVCAYAIDVDLPFRSAPLGCRTIVTQVALPTANWEVLSASGSTISVSGWAVDTDSPRAAVPVHVYVDGQGVGLTADGQRADVGAAFPGAGGAHGFGWSGTVAPGPHTVCAYAIDVNLPFRSAPLGCRTIVTQAALPTANWEVLSASGSTISVSGWAVDTDSPTEVVPVHLYVDGRGLALAADLPRPDVGAAFPGSGIGHGFGWSGVVAPGTHSVCVYPIDVDLPSRSTPLGCRTIRTG